MVNKELKEEYIQISQQYVDEELSKKLSSMWDKISVVLGGSICFGGVDEFSDIDLFVSSSGDEIKKFLPITTEYAGKKLVVEIGYSWDEVQGFFENLPTNAESIFGGIQKAIILHDPSNRYRKIQERVNQYLPDDFWKNKILTKWFGVFYTSNNGVVKALKRNDSVTVQIWKGELLQDIMELTFLLNRQYLPSKKWLYLNFCELPVLSEELESHLKKVIKVENVQDMEEESKAVWGIINTFIKENKILSPEMADKPWKFI